MNSLKKVGYDFMSYIYLLSNSLVVIVLMALAVHCYHHRRAARGARASEVQLSAAQLVASQARMQDLELELAAV